MTHRHQGESPKKALPGETLLVIHDFEARSPDELSLRKGDRIELVEKDDDFGDGWYLGKLLSTGVSGLFPEVYTTVAPRPSHGAQVITNGDTVRRMHDTSSKSPALTEINFNAGNDGDVYQNANTRNLQSQSLAQSYQDEISPTNQDFGGDGTITPTDPNQTSETESARVAPLNPAQSPQRVASVPSHTFASPPLSTGLQSQRSISMVMQGSHDRQASPVIHETLNVIDEHITDMNTPRSSVLHRGGHDSGSEYSTAHVDHRASYVMGDESDEDERAAFSEEEVSKWTPSHVARYLESIGVDRKHCEIFKEQEISGDLLLNLDQASVFMKEFDLGVVGRRLRTWHKIRAFQEQVRSNRDLNSRAGDFFDEPFTAGSQGSGAKLPKIPSLMNRSATTAAASANPRRQDASQFQPRPASHMDRVDTVGASVLKQPITDSPISIRGNGLQQSSQQSSRRHSSIDYKPADSRSSIVPDTLDTSLTTLGGGSVGGPHRKQPSLDRDWSLAGATAAAKANDTLSPDSSKIPGSLTPRSEHRLSVAVEKAEELDRGYMSGGELDSGRLRNVLRKREGGASAGHSRQSSYRDDSAALGVSKRHSRFGSAGSIREAFNNMTGRTRAQSTKESSLIGESPRESGPPMVTRLDYPTRDEASILSSDITKVPSEATQSTDKTPINSPSIVSPVGESLSNSPRTSTAASGKALSEDSNDSSLKKGRSAKTPIRQKHKSKTSAYIRGLRKVSPKEAVSDCDYSGWMKKKSPGLLAVWRPRLFVLHGRRLAYYYSEDDVEEKGLIDISSHRVLPAESEFLAGIHATATRAAAVPTSPPNATIQTMNAVEAAQFDKAEAKSPRSPRMGDGNMFIFKLVPPRAGLSKAVQFTKPTVHYFATDNVKQGRLWMAALMKATIDRDDSKPVTSSYQQKTISLTKAKAMRQRPPALMGVDEEALKREIERVDQERQEAAAKQGVGKTPVQGASNGGSGDQPPGSAKTELSTTTPTTSPTVTNPFGGLNIAGVDFKPSTRVSDNDLAGSRAAGLAGASARTGSSPDRPSLRLVRSMSNDKMQDSGIGGSTGDGIDSEKADNGSGNDNEKDKELGRTSSGNSRTEGILPSGLQTSVEEDTTDLAATLTGASGATTATAAATTTS